MVEALVARGPSTGCPDWVGQTLHIYRVVSRRTVHPDFVRKKWQKGWTWPFVQIEILASFCTFGLDIFPSSSVPEKVCRNFSTQKWCLQELADDLGLVLTICHFPPGTSKWNKIEHRLFSFISQNWRGKPLVSLEAIVNLIAATSTRTGLIVKAALDPRRYETAVKVPDDVFAHLTIAPHRFHGDWNYTISPRR